MPCTPREASVKQQTMLAERRARAGDGVRPCRPGGAGQARGPGGAGSREQRGARGIAADPRRAARWVPGSRRPHRPARGRDRRPRPAGDAARRLVTVPGIGPLAASLIAATVGGNIGTFRSGRHFAAWLGLVPGRTRPAARPASGGSRRRATGRSDASSCSGPRRWCTAPQAWKGAVGAWTRGAAGALPHRVAGRLGAEQIRQRRSEPSILPFTRGAPAASAADALRRAVGKAGRQFALAMRNGVAVQPGDLGEPLHAATALAGRLSAANQWRCCSSRRLSRRLIGRSAADRDAACLSARERSRTHAKQRRP